MNDRKQCHFCHSRRNVNYQDFNDLPMCANCAEQEEDDDY